MLKQILTGSFICAAFLVAGLSAQAQEPAPQEAQTQTAPPAGAQEPAAQPAPAPDQSAPAPANAELSQQEAEQFAKAVKEIRRIQEEAQSQTQEILQTEGLSIDRFNELLQSRRDPQTQPTTEATPEEEQNFNEALTKISEIQQTTQQQMEQAVSEQGLEVRRFNEILALARSNPEVRQQLEQQLQNN